MTILTADGITYTIRPAPDREPPFDDELDPNAPEPPGPMQLALPFPPWRPPHRHRVAITPRSARRAAAGDPVAVGRRILVGVCEVASRRRPMHQLNGLLSPRIADKLGQSLEAAPAGRRPHRLANATVLSVHSSEPAECVAEVFATLSTRTRVFAAALRLEVRRGQWVCTNLQI